jgi:hypothetical protein
MKISVRLSGAMFIAADRTLVALGPPAAVPNRPSPCEDNI